MNVADIEQAPSGTITAAPHGQRKAVIFQLAGQTYGIFVDAIQEILLLPGLSRPLGLPPIVMGFFTLGGMVIPVIRLARLFGLGDSAPSMYTPLLITRGLGRPVALMVDAVHQIAAVEESALSLLQEHVCLNDCAQRLIQVGSANVVLLAHRRLLCEQERLRIVELAEMEEARLHALMEAQP